MKSLSFTEFRNKASEILTLVEKGETVCDSKSGKTKMDDWSELYLWPSLIAFFAFIVLLPLTVFGIIHLYMWWPFRNTATSFNRKK